MPRYATIKDIADALGISKSTVSRALADRFDVKPETRKAVMEMAEKLHYKPNPNALNLLKKRSKIIGVVVPEFINSFFPHIIMAIQKVFEEKGFHVLITQSNESAEVELKNLKLLESSMVEGIIISVAHNDINTEYYKELIDSGMPLVFFNRISQGIDAPKVIIDDFKMSCLAVEHLITTGKRKIMHFKGPDDILSSDDRKKGYCYTLNKFKISYDEKLIVNGGLTREEGYQAMLKCLEEGNIPDALFAFNDQLAIGAMRAIKQKGYKIPQDIAVFGFSESQSAQLTEPPLSSVAQPLSKIGSTAATLLLEKIENPETENKTVVLPAKLNIRASSDPNAPDY